MSYLLSTEDSSNVIHIKADFKRTSCLNLEKMSEIKF